MKRAVVLSVCLCWPGSLAAATGDRATPTDWPQWRGPSRDGQAGGPTWPERLNDQTLRQLWRVDDLGPSYCGPLVAGDLIFTAETRDEQTEVVQAYERSSGEKVWETSWSGAIEVPFFARRNGSWIRSTPAFDGERLYVAGMRDVLVCLDGATGNELWRVDFVAQLDAPPPDFGFVCSPLVTEAHVYVQAGASFCKLDKMTGEIIWRTLEDAGGMFGSAFSSPVLTELHGRSQLIVLTRTHMNGVDPETGNVLWNRPIKSFRGMNILTPIVHGNSVFTAPYGGRSQLLDIGQDHSVTARWDNRIQGYMTTPVIIDGHAYYFTRSNRFTCVRLADGDIMWTSPPTGDAYWSLVAQGDRILAASEDGLLRLIQATPEALVVVDELPVAESQTWAHVAVAGSQVVIREQRGLVVCEWREPRRDAQPNHR